MVAMEMVPMHHHDGVMKHIVCVSPLERVRGDLFLLILMVLPWEARESNRKVLHSNMPVYSRSPTWGSFARAFLLGRLVFTWGV